MIWFLFRFNKRTEWVSFSIYHFLFTFVTGEYFVSLKNYKIPLKSIDANNPPPPGTEDMSLANAIDTYDSPLATINRLPAQATSPIQTKAASVQPQTDPSSKLTKRSSLFSKVFSMIIKIIDEWIYAIEIEFLNSSNVAKFSSYFWAGIAIEMK